MVIAKQVAMPNCILAEGCVWGEEEAVLYFTDIEGCMIYRFRPETGVLEGCAAGSRTGCLVLHRDGGIVAAETNQLVYRQNDLQWQNILLRQDFPDYMRYNDGKCDRFGNLWLGTMASDQSHPKAQAGGSLYCIKDGQVVAAYAGYTIPNGLAWNSDGSIFYHIDTVLRRIDACDVRDETVLVNRRTVVAIPESEGKPDGMCIDADGNLWTAMWGGGRVNGYHLPSGQKIEEIQVPDRYVTCCCFGGTDGKQLYITTARDESGAGGQIYRVEMPVGGGKIYQYGGAANGAAADGA